MTLVEQWEAAHPGRKYRTRDKDVVLVPDPVAGVERLRFEVTS